MVRFWECLHHVRYLSCFGGVGLCKLARVKGLGLLTDDPACGCGDSSMESCRVASSLKETW